MAFQAKELYGPKETSGKVVGMIRTKSPGVYSARLRIPLGIMTSEVAAGVAKLAKKFGTGDVYLTTRLGIELPGIKEAEFPKLREELAKVGVELAGCGPRMRSTVACKGTVCTHGNIDTFGLAWEVDRAHNDAALLPHKFKVAVGGCASSCAKPPLNDVGLVGAASPRLLPESCIGCGLCVQACSVGAVQMADKQPVFEQTKCVDCGDCMRACPRSALEKEHSGIDLYAGGRWGRVRQVGLRIARWLTEEEAVASVGRIKAWYAVNGVKKERLGQTILRIGAKEFQREVLAGIDKVKWAKLKLKGFKPIRD